MNPRLRRLQADFELVRDSLSGHPHITVEPVGSRLPPETYNIEYRVKGLFLDGSQPNFREVHKVELMLPRRYPAEKPYAVPLTPIFHPNIREYYCIADYWAAGTTLVDVISKMGDMIQWRIYNVASPLDGIAARWASENEDSGIFPVGNVEFGVKEVDISLRKPVAPPTESALPDEKPPSVETAPNAGIPSAVMPPPPLPPPPTGQPLPTSSVSPADEDDDFAIGLR